MLFDYLKNIKIFSVTGFGNVVSFKSIGHQEMKKIEDFLRKNVLLLSSKFSNKKDIFGETYYGNPSEFQFRPGDVIFIQTLVDHVKNIIDKKGLSYFKNKTSDAEIQAKEKQNEETTICNDTKTHYFLNKLLSAANINAKRDKGGYRYDTDIKLYSTYLRMLIGPLAYQTLQSNLEHSIPSLPSTNRYMQYSGCHVTEGILRCEELSLYLADQNVDPFVCISEDATRITPKIQ